MTNKVGTLRITHKQQSSSLSVMALKPEKLSFAISTRRITRPAASTVTTLRNNKPFSCAVSITLTPSDFVGKPQVQHQSLVRIPASRSLRPPSMRNIPFTKEEGNFQQPPGTDALEAREQLLIFMKEADVDRKGVEDISSMMMQNSFTGPVLKAKMGAEKTPYLEMSNVIIESHKAGKKAANTLAMVNTIRC